MPRLNHAVSDLPVGHSPDLAVALRGELDQVLGRMKGCLERCIRLADAENERPTQNAAELTMTLAMAKAADRDCLALMTLLGPA